MPDRKPDAPDLSAQLESLFDQVWRSEREQDFVRRILAAVQAEENRAKRRLRRPRR